MGLRSTIAAMFRPVPVERSISWPGWTPGVNNLWPFVNFGGNTYPFGLTQTLPGGKAVEIEPTYQGLAAGAYLDNPVVYACVEARKALFSEARFMYRQRRSGTPGELFSNPDLDILTTPWPGGTTGDLLARMSQHEDLGGNGFVVRLDATTLFQPQPDWVTVVLGADKRSSRALPIGIIYHPGGRGSGVEVETFPWEQVAHYMPTPDPLAPFRGVSWLRVLAREVSADIAATDHKLRFFEAGATPNMIVSVEQDLTGQAWKEWVEKFRDNYEGLANSYKTMLLGKGATAMVVGRDLQQADSKNVQGAGETRIAAAAGVPPVVVGLSEGLQGSSLNAGNFTASMRRFADITMRPRWRNAAGSLAKLVRVPSASELWYDDSDIAALKDDISARAAVIKEQMLAIESGVRGGFTPDSAVDAIVSGDLKRLAHTGLYSVQLQPPGTKTPDVTVEPIPPKQIPAKTGRAAALAPLIERTEA